MSVTLTMMADGTSSISEPLDTQLTHSVDAPCPTNCEITQYGDLLVTATVDNEGVASISASDSSLHELSDYFEITCESTLSEATEDKSVT